MRLSRSIFTFLAICLLTCSCSGEDAGDGIDRLQAGFREASSIGFSADIRADHGDRVYDYGVSYRGCVSAGTVTVTKPELIAGVTAKLSDGSARLSYDGTEIYTGEILPGGLSPLDAVPVLLDVFANGLVTEASGEKWENTACLAVLFRIDDRVNARAWFASETDLPLHAEIYLDGSRVISCDFYNMKVE